MKIQEVFRIYMCSMSRVPLSQPQLTPTMASIGMSHTRYVTYSKATITNEIRPLVIVKAAGCEAILN